MIIKLAGKIIQINHLYPYVCEYCRDYLYDANEDQIDFMIEINKSDIEVERRKSEKEAIREKRNVRKFSDEYLETLAVYRKIAEHMLDYDTLLFHGSVVAVDGRDIFLQRRVEPVSLHMLDCGGKFLKKEQLW